MRKQISIGLVAIIFAVVLVAGLIAMRTTNKPRDGREEGVKGAFLQTPTATKDGDPEGEGNKDKGEEKIESGARTGVRDGQTFIVLTKEIMQRDGIETTTVAGESEALTVTAFGKVIMPQVLAADASMYSSASAAYKAALSKRDASEKEYERLKTLNATKNVSDKVFQGSLAQYDADAAAANATSQDLQAAKTTLQQQWGPIVSKWLTDPGNMSSRILDAKDLLVEASLPSGAGPLSDIRHGVIDLPGDKSIEAKYLSPAASVNPDIQGPAYFFLVPGSQSSLLPGMNVTVHIVAGKVMSGLSVPSSAVVWLNGGTWVYAQTQGDEFTRRAISTDTQVPGGFLVTGGLEVGDRIVTKGAQLLLSQEFSSQIREKD